jgi:hypothetical protein
MQVDHAGIESGRGGQGQGDAVTGERTLSGAQVDRVNQQVKVIDEPGVQQGAGEWYSQRYRSPFPAVS